MKNPIKNFSLKFIDIMVGVVLGLGLQWWPDLKEPWQYIAFIFSYIFIVDFWIDYGPSLKKFPPKKEIDVLLDVALIFCLFFCIYTTHLAILYFLISFIMLFVFDYFWLLSSKKEYQPIGQDKTYVDTWMRLDLFLGAGLTILVIIIGKIFSISSLVILLIFIFINAILRILSIWKYKRFYLS